MRELTARQQEVLDRIKAYIREHGTAPTRAELAADVGLADPSSVRSHLKRLVEEGYIEIREDKYRGIRLLNDDMPLVKRLAEVAAGTPIVCEEHIVERVPAVIAERFRPRPDYLLLVRGDSMNRTGLRDGDVVAIRKTTVAETGQVVVARFGDEVTLKRFVRIDERHVELHPESYNTAHKVEKLDLAKHILEIDGVVVGALIAELRDAGKEAGEEDHRPRPRRMKAKTKL